jgi:TolB-like protein/Tfp pilus assembly protein PilF
MAWRKISVKSCTESKKRPFFLEFCFPSAIHYGDTGRNRMGGLRIALLGGLDIAGGDSSKAALTRKARALVAYLALQGARGQSREKLAALLWGDSSEEQARANLRQALSTIRKALNGVDARLVADADQVALAGDDIDLDVARFEDLVAEASPNALEQAAALYRGDLLDGFSLREEPFEAWARAKRERLRHLASDALTRLIVHCDETGDTERCIETAARLLALDPLRESAHRILMRAYATQGRKASALRQFETCRDILKRELGVEPEAETVALYRDIRQQRAATAQERLDELLAETVENPPLPDGPSIAVLPFENLSGDPTQEYFSDGISEDIITALSKIGSLLVVARNSTFAYKGQSVDVKRVGREQGVRYVLEGSVQKAGKQVRVTAQLIDVTTGGHVWGERYDRDLEDTFAVQDEITREVAVSLDIHLSSGEQARFWSAGTKNLEAWECVRRGIEALNRVTPEDKIEARRLIERALVVDPNYPMAWVSLGWLHFHESEVSIAFHADADREAALASAVDCTTKAFELDPSCADAYALSVLCHLSMRAYDDAITMSNQAIALAPNHSENLAMLAAALNKLGQPERSYELITKAMRLSPIYPGWYLNVLATACRLLGRNDAAIAAFEEGISRNPDYLGLHVGLASTLGELSRPEDAKKPVAELLRLDPDFSISKYMAGLSYRDPAEFERFADGLRSAGLPE